MWGRLYANHYGYKQCRNTPTHVGKIFRLEVLLTSNPETPPRMWGRLIGKEQACQVNGNTPTHVGKMIFETFSLREGKKHPHACGEDARWGAITCSTRETPPRMWGRSASYEQDGP